MTVKRPTPDETAGKGRRKSAAPTIDLTATDVTAADAAAADVRASDVPPVSRDNDQPPPVTALDEPLVEPQVAAAPEPGVASPPPSSPSIDDAPRKDRSSAPILPLLAAGVAGAAVMSAVLAAAWFAGLLPTNDTGSERIAGLETQVQDLQKRPVPTTQGNAADTRTIETLTQRLGRLEESLAKLPSGDPALAERVNAADNALKSLGVALTALNSRNDQLAANATQARERAEAAEKAVADLRSGLQDVSKTASAGASSADLAPLQQRIAALEQAAKTANADIAKATAADNAARLALSAAALRDAVVRSAPFPAELAQAKSLGADAAKMAPLEPFAANGLPNERALASELGALLPGMIKAAGSPPASGGFIERLQANAGQLVRIRPVDAPVGDDAATVLARLEVNAAKGDIAGALADLNKLTEAQRAPAQAWIAKANARTAALAAAQGFASDTARSLGSK